MPVPFAPAASLVASWMANPGADTKGNRLVTQASSFLFGAQCVRQEVDPRAQTLL